jgi:hypothetical protein
MANPYLICCSISVLILGNPRYGSTYVLFKAPCIPYAYLKPAPGAASSSLLKHCFTFLRRVLSSSSLALTLSSIKMLCSSPVLMMSWRTTRGLSIWANDQREQRLWRESKERITSKIRKHVSNSASGSL